MLQSLKCYVLSWWELR